MSLCINPYCRQPEHPQNDGSRVCQSCGTELVLLGRYRVMRLLSDHSGFGNVYEAYDRSTPKILKVLKPTLSDNEKAVELFQQEAVVLSQLPHPGIPAIEPQSYFQLQPVGSPAVLHCLIMEKIDGPNLREWMLQQGNHPISEQQALQWLQQLVEILHLVHQKHYFHRDIKPENIMLRSTGQLVLVDFGAAREMTYSYLAQVGKSGGITRISSAGYTPPEQERGQAVPQSDFYALGYTFVYLLTGKLPTDVEIYDSLNNECYWRAAAPQVSPPFAHLIDRLIAPKASERPKDTATILTAVREIIKQRQAMQPVKLFSSDAETYFEGIDPTHPLAQQPRVLPAPTPAASRKWLWGGVALLLVAIGGYAGWQVWSTSSVSSDVVPIATVQTLTGHTGEVRSVIFSPDGRRLISSSTDQTIKVWDAATGTLLTTLSGHTSTVKVLAITSDGKTLISGSDDQTLKVWDLTTATERLTLRGHSSYINALRVTPDGQQVISASADRSIKIWNLATGQEQRTLIGHTSFVNDIAISPDGQILASAGADQTIRFWDLATGENLTTLTGHTSYVNSVVFSPDGNQLISASADQTIKIWALTAQMVPKEKPEAILRGHQGYVEKVAISPDGRWLLSANSDQTLTLWDLKRRSPLSIFTGFSTHIRQFSVSPDWQTIASGSGTQVEQWQIPPFGF